ncbi:MAG TPA: sulfurtransferase [Dehalococcoidia bacterium]|nr:sulfurtransferase [Dehalococcoidia bacterium]
MTTAPGPLVTTDWLARHLDDRDVRVVETGTDRATTYDEGHVPGALWVDPHTELLREGDESSGEVITPQQFAALMSRLGVTPSTLVVAYGDQGGRHATRLFWTCRMYGHDAVCVVDGGREAWLAEGRPVTRETPVVTPTAYPVPEPRPGFDITAEEIRDRLGRPDFVVLDVRTPEEYRGEDVRAARGGHIPGAILIPWTATLTEDYHLKPLDELRALFRDAGVTPDRTVAVHCQLGVRASHTWFVLTQALGYRDVRNYDGSWQEWGNRPDLPIER